MEINLQPLAFPSTYSWDMTLRDYFAGQALIGLIINPASCSVHCPISERAYELADALLARKAEQT